MSNFSIFFPTDQKNLFGSGQKVSGSKADQLLIYSGSKVSSGRVRADLYSTERLNLNDIFLREILTTLMIKGKIGFLEK